MGMIRTKRRMEMDLERNKKALGLIETFPGPDCTDDVLSIWHLEKIIIEVEPYGTTWFMGRIKALRHAISVLTERSNKAYHEEKRIYDEKNDVMYISFFDSGNSRGDEIINGLVILRDNDSNSVTGITIFDFSKKFKL